MERGAAELRRVAWPDRAHLWQATLVVIVAVVIVGTYLYALDSVFKPLAGWIAEKAGGVCACDPTKLPSAASSSVTLSALLTTSAPPVAACGFVYWSTPLDRRHFLGSGSCICVPRV